MLRPLSDEDFLARIRRTYESRRKVGFLILLLGVSLIAGTVWGYVYSTEAARKFMAVLADAPTTTENAKQIVDMSTFFLGFKLGGALTGLAVAGGHLLGYGIYLLWGQRKERMLLELSRREKEAKY